MPEELFGIDIIYYIIALIVIAIITVYLMVSYFIYKRIMVNHNNPPIDLVDHTEEFYKDSYQWFQEIPVEDVHITSYDNLKLHGYYIPPFDKKSNNLAIVVHGYQSKATDMIIIGQMYVKMGFQVLLIDLRSHGESEGTFTTFGYYEKYDLKRWINFALRTYGADLNILIHGVSMGAATAMMTVGLDIPKNVKFLLLDSGFTTVKKTFLNANKTKMLRFFFLGIDIILYSKHKFLLEQIRPLKYMRKNQIPFLIVQGDLDRAVPLDMAKKLYSVSIANKKDIYIVRNSKHALGFYDDFEGTKNAVYQNTKGIFNIKKTYTINIE